MDIKDTQLPHASELLALMSGFGHQVVNKPTRMTSTSSMLIDLLFCNDPEFLHRIQVTSELGASDHCSISCCITLLCPATVVYRRKVWLYQKADFDTLNEALEASLPPEAVLTRGDVNGTWPLLYTAFMDTVCRHVPCKLVTCKKSLPPWITIPVTRAFCKRDHARRVAKRLNLQRSWATFRRLRNLAVSAVRRAKRGFFVSMSQSTNTFWKTYHRLGQKFHLFYSTASFPPQPP